MTTRIKRLSATDTPTAPGITITRIRFVAGVPTEGKVLRRFKQPFCAVAIEETLTEPHFPAHAAWPEPTDSLDVIFLTRDELRREAEVWMETPAQPDAVPAVLIERDGESVTWRPGRTLVRCRSEMRAEFLAALADFTFYEGELRKLEAAVEAGEETAMADVERAFRIRPGDRRHWNRFGELIESYARMRLKFARLEPRLAKGSRTLPREGRRLMSHLIVRADVEARLEALSDRLEACEDLYEGATDRVADFRWYRNGHLLEVTIIVLLLIEGALMAGELTMRYLEYRSDNAADETEQVQPGHVGSWKAKK
jgi:hypothetical protein